MTCIGNFSYAFATETPDTESLPLLLEVFLNGESTQMIGSFQLYSDGRLAARREDLTGLGIEPGGEGTADDLVMLDNLSGLAFSYDEPRQRLDIAIEVDRRTTNSFDARGTSDRPDKARSDYGLRVNYLLYGATGSYELEDLGNVARNVSFETTSAQIESALYSPFGQFHQSALATYSGGKDFSLRRLDTTLVHPRPESAVVFRAGDVVSGSLAWTRAVRIGGLQIARDFALKPDLVTVPLPSVSGTAAVPTTVDIFVGNVRTFSRELPVGPYVIQNIPGLTGAGNARVVIQDATGRMVEKELPFYVAPELVKKGLLDFSVQLGLPRLSYGSDGDAYALVPVGIGAVRYGLLDTLTIEGEAEFAPGLYGAGIGIVTTAGRLGLLSLAGRFSHYKGNTGAMVHAAFETEIANIAIQASSDRTFGKFEDVASVTARPARRGIDGNAFELRTLDISLPDTIDGSDRYATTRLPRAVDRLSISAPLPFARTSAALGYIHMESSTGSHSHIITGSVTKLVGERASVSVNGYMDLVDRQSFSIFAGVSLPLGSFARSSIGLSHNAGRSQATFEAARPLGRLPGDYGWRVRDSEDGEEGNRKAQVAYRSRFGRVQGSIDQSGSSFRAEAEAEGSVVVSQAGVFFGNRVDSAFAVVKVGAPGVGVFHQNRLVGTTGATGRLLVPDLVPYENNAISIDATTLPVGANIAKTRAVVVPRADSGVHVDFDVEAAPAAAVITFVDAAGKPLDVGLEGRLAATAQRFTIGYGGEAYIDGLEPTNSVTIDLLESECTATFDYSPDATGQTFIEGVVCQ
ncbi:MAG: fimbria/pilus outer membrane usher protein [Hyphomicrobiales bacterium]